MEEEIHFLGVGASAALVVLGAYWHVEVVYQDGVSLEEEAALVAFQVVPAEEVVVTHGAFQQCLQDLMRTTGQEEHQQTVDEVDQPVIEDFVQQAVVRQH